MRATLDVRIGEAASMDPTLCGGAPRRIRGGTRAAVRVTPRRVRLSLPAPRQWPERAAARGGEEPQAVSHEPEAHALARADRRAARDRDDEARPRPAVDAEEGLAPERLHVGDLALERA